MRHYATCRVVPPTEVTDVERCRGGCGRVVKAGTAYCCPTCKVVNGPPPTTNPWR